MLKTIVLLIIGFLPSLFSLWMIRKTQERIRARTRQVALSHAQIGQHIRPVEGERYYLEGVGYLVGDISCKFNARSGYVRCAVNPSGPCQNCRHYEARDLASSENSV